MFANGQEDQIINYLRTFKIQDLTSYRGLEGFTTTYSRLLDDKRTFVKSQYEMTRFNIFQLAIHYNYYSLVKYILKEHKVLSSTKQQKNVDPRIILLGPE